MPVRNAGRSFRHALAGRADKTACTSERAGGQFQTEKALRLARSRQLEGSGQFGIKSEAAVVGRIAHEQNRPVTGAPRVTQSTLDQRRTDAASARVHSNGDGAQ
jgi:hypothetical protein